MNYKLGDIIVTKKPHVCGSTEWEIIRTGADVKIKCVKCSREIIMLKSILDKKIKHISTQ